MHAGRTVNVPANQRGLGMVFQSYAIWPHMSVFDNVAFPLQVRRRGSRPGRREIRERVEKVLDTMELGHLADRRATKLSGGQQQRLALARAIVIEPPVLLLDEPLSNLDAKLRETLRYELKRLQRELGITSVYVTHDQIEALALSTSVAVMRDGKVVQVGRPREVYENPSCRFVAEFIGTSNFLPGVVRHRDGRGRRGGDRLRVGAPAVGGRGAGRGVGRGRRCGPSACEIGTASVPGRPNEWQGTVVNRAFLGDAIDHIVRIGQGTVRVRGNPSVSLAPGTDVFVAVEPAKVALVPVD